MRRRLLMKTVVCHMTDPRGFATAVLLDFFNTLARPRSIEHWLSVAQSRVPYETPQRSDLTEKIDRVWRDAKELDPAANWDLRPELHRSTFISTLQREGSISLALAEALYDTMQDQWDLTSGAAEFIARASSRGLLLAVVSNTALDIRPALAKWGLGSAFGAIVLSHEVGFVKPDPQIFQIAADMLAVETERCVMIGDSVQDDSGGAVLGMQCVITTPQSMWRAFELVCPR